MYLLEHDAKELLAHYGAPVPQGVLIEDADSLPDELPPGPWVVKGQITRGGRGKAGLIRTAATREHVGTLVLEMLNTSVSGRSIAGVRIEERIADVEEAYFGLLVDAAAAAVRVIVSDQGGMDIESLPQDAIRWEAAAPEPEAIVAAVARLAARMSPHKATALHATAERLAPLFFEREAVLVEVNPLFVRADGSWVAADAKIVVDGNALGRQSALRALLEKRAAVYPEIALKLEHGFDYVVVDPQGEIGLLTTGAGLSMMLIDELRAAGLSPYNFLDIRTGGLRGEITRIVTVLEWLGAAPRVRVVLINIFAGITDLGEFAGLLVRALREAPGLRAPVVARLVGNGLPAAREVLGAAGIPVRTELAAALSDVRRHLAC
jgi:succinyl-CoA synthetase beta subunit